MFWTKTATALIVDLPRMVRLTFVVDLVRHLLQPMVVVIHVIMVAHLILLLGPAQLLKVQVLQESIELRQRTKMV